MKAILCRHSLNGQKLIDKSIVFLKGQKVSSRHSLNGQKLIDFEREKMCQQIVGRHSLNGQKLIDRKEFLCERRCRSSQPKRPEANRLRGNQDMTVATLSSQPKRPEANRFIEAGGCYHESWSSQPKRPEANRSKGGTAMKYLKGRHSLNGQKLIDAVRQVKKETLLSSQPKRPEANRFLKSCDCCDFKSSQPKRPEANRSNTSGWSV